MAGEGWSAEVGEDAAVDPAAEGDAGSGLGAEAAGEGPFEAFTGASDGFGL